MLKVLVVAAAVCFCDALQVWNLEDPCVIAGFDMDRLGPCTGLSAWNQQVRGWQHGCEGNCRVCLLLLCLMHIVPLRGHRVCTASLLGECNMPFMNTIKHVRLCHLACAEETFSPRCTLLSSGIWSTTNSLCSCPVARLMWLVVCHDLDLMLDLVMQAHSSADFSMSQPGCLVLSCRVAAGHPNADGDGLLHAIIKTDDLFERRVETWGPGLPWSHPHPGCVQE